MSHVVGIRKNEEQNFRLYSEKMEMKSININCFSLDHFHFQNLVQAEKRNRNASKLARVHPSYQYSLAPQVFLESTKSWSSKN